VAFSVYCFTSLVVSLPLVNHLLLVDTLFLEVDMAGVGLVEDFGNTLVVLVVQHVVVVELKRLLLLWLQVVLL
jgi:hypothetical protein